MGRGYIQKDNLLSSFKKWKYFLFSKGFFRYFKDAL